MNVLGLDMSSQKSGYALYVDGKLTDWGAWELSSDAEKDWRKRLQQLRPSRAESGKVCSRLRQTRQRHFRCGGRLFCRALAAGSPD